VIRAVLVKMRVGRDSSCYARDGRYFGAGTRNYNVSCDACGNPRTIGAPDRKTAIARYRASMGCLPWWLAEALDLHPCETCGRA